MENGAMTRAQFDDFMDTLKEAMQASVFYDDRYEQTANRWTNEWAVTWGPILLEKAGITLVKIKY